jgi:unsaturated rhamnogalacturonyl hydrolase
MHRIRFQHVVFLMLCTLFSLSCATKRKMAMKPNEAINLLIKVNDKWQTDHPEHGWAFWDCAAYHTGNMEAYTVTGIERYRAYSEAWAIKNQWKGAKSDDKSKWRYSYGETDNHVLFGDWQICFQTYIDLFNLSNEKDSTRILRAIEVMDYQMSTPQNDYWWWIDGLYMVMPVMVKLYKLTGDERYIQKMNEYFAYTKQVMYDADEGLFYRDAKYLFPKHKTLNGKKDFWSRGNGWVIAGLAKTISDLPDEEPIKAELISIYLQMAAAVKKCQTHEGYWTRSLHDMYQSPGPETSGTAFFTYALLWGINNGLLSEKEYFPTVWLAWDYLKNVAIQADGTVGFVQPIGERAIPGQLVDAASSSNFGVGAVLLAASEMHRYSQKQR